MAEVSSSPKATNSELGADTAVTAPEEPAQSYSDTSSETGDSTLGESDIESSYTASITSSITAYQHEHGRRYHAYQAGKYVLPNDEREQERLDLQYHAFRLAYKDETHFAPIGKDPKLVLDVGTGTGIWAIDISDKFPNSEIIGTDLSPIQPQWVPPNVKFEVDDAEQPWTFPENHFDYVHTRIMVGCLHNWDNFYKQAFKHLKPGAWLESQEMSLDPLTPSDAPPLPEDSHVAKWCSTCEDGMGKIGLSLKLRSLEEQKTNGGVGYDLPAKMKAAGFTNIHIHEFKIPIGSWPTDPKERETGVFQLVAMLEGLHGLTIALWTRVLGWTESEIELFLAGMRKEWKDPKVKTYWPLYSICGQKPEA